MKKLCRLLAIFSPLLLVAASGCSPQDATQTVVEVWPDMPLKDQIQTVKVQAWGLPQERIESNETQSPVVWPVRLTFTPSSKTASHRFRMVLSAFDASNKPIANFTLEADIVEEASHYVQVRVGEQCRPENCENGVCYALVDDADLSKSHQEAVCNGSAAASSSGVSSANAGSGDMTLTGTGNTAQPGTGPGSMPTSTGPAATSGISMMPSGQLGQDAGMALPPASTDAECQNSPCGPNGECHLKPDAPNKYVCTCNTGFEVNDSATTCVVRNDCTKNNGGCDGRCETVIGTGEATCTCQGNTWLKGDGKACADVQPEELLSTSSGSVQRTRPQVAFDSQGNAVVAWTETSDDGKHTMWSARYSAATKTWTKPSGPFVTGSTNAADLHLALDTNGSGLLVWTATVNSHRQLWAAPYRNNTFSYVDARHIDSATDSDVLMPAFALDSAGDGLVAWTDVMFPKSSLRVARYAASSNAFTAMPVLGSPGDNMVMKTSVAVHNMNSGLIAWTDVPVSMAPDGGVPNIEFTRSAAFNTNVGLGLGQRIGFDGTPVPPPSTSPDVAMDAQGRGIAVWLRSNGASSDSYTLLSGVYVSGSGWGTATPETLADNANITSAPHIVVGADGSAFTVWRETVGTDINAKARGALSFGKGFEPAHDFGLASDAVSWSDADTMNWTPETAVKLLDWTQPNWDLAVGPKQTGFVVGAAFNSSSMPAQRELWLQRVASQQEPARPIRFTAADSVPARPSPPKIGMNANGDGAVVWDRQRDGHYFVYVSLLK